MMKARQYNRRIFTENVRPQVYHPAGWSDGEEYGSLIKVDEIPPKPEPPQGQLTMFDDYERDLRVWNFRRLLAQKYDVVVTNPPYMGNKGHNEKLSEYLQKNYTDYKSDTFSAFIIRCGEMAKPSGFVGMFSPYVWMFIQSYEKLRNNLYNTKNITTLIQFEYSAFEEATVPVCSFVYRNKKTCEKGVYFRLVDYRGGMEVQRQKYLEALENPDCGFFYTASTENFKKIPGSPVAYWVSDKMLRAFEVGKRIGDIGIPRQGSTLGDNATFIRFWFEVVENRNKWFKCMKGGEYRRWYGNLLYLVDWENNGARVKATGRATIRSENMLFKEGVTWTNITSGLQSFRIMEKDFFFESTGTVCFVNSELLKYLLGFLNTPITEFVAKLLNPTLHLQSGDVANIPLIVSDKAKKSVDEIVTANISLSRSDWDSFETSWDFKRHPLINGERTVANAYSKWKEEANNRFNALKANEEELNRIFIDIYGLQDELTPEVEDKDVTVHRIYDNKEDIPESMAGSKYALTRQDVIKSFISYAVGCMFGRYSLDVEGLAYAGGEWDEGKYKTFIPDKDNVLPICDDEYFGDDIVGRFVEFVKVVYGAETLEENLKFIADALGGRGTPREVIRSYFLNDFYKDHCKTYKKRPIYWLFDSGKKNGFKALIYLHRYTRDLLAKLRTDYVHEQQERYRTQLSHINAALNAAKGAERARLLKQQNKLTEQLKEVAVFEEKVHHLADQKIEIDLDDGVKKNYAIFADVLAKI